MNRLNRMMGMASALVIGMVAIQGLAYADPGPGPRHERIVGVWDVEVAIFNCATNVPMGSFVALHQYQLGGTGQVVPAGSPTALSAHMMIWNHVKKDDYQMSVKMYRFDGSGNYIGWVVLNNEVSINKDADEYVGSGVAEFFDTAGNYLFSSCPSLIGTRFEG